MRFQFPLYLYMFHFSLSQEANPCLDVLVFISTQELKDVGAAEPLIYAGF